MGSATRCNTLGGDGCWCFRAVAALPASPHTATRKFVRHANDSFVGTDMTRFVYVASERASERVSASASVLVSVRERAGER